MKTTHTTVKTSTKTITKKTPVLTYEVWVAQVEANDRQIEALYETGAAIEDTSSPESKAIYAQYAEAMTSAMDYLNGANIPQSWRIKRVTESKD